MVDQSKWTSLGPILKDVVAAFARRLLVEIDLVSQICERRDLAAATARAAAIISGVQRHTDDAMTDLQVLVLDKRDRRSE